MKINLVAIIVLTSLLTSACTQLGGTRFKRSYLSIKDANDKTVGTLLVWEADTSAAILFRDGQACMQTALAIKTTNMEAEAKLSDALLSLSETAAKVATEGIDQTDKASSDALADITASIKEAASLLTTTTERTAFLNMGMFYICQVSANGSITDIQTDKLIKILIEESAGISDTSDIGK